MFSNKDLKNLIVPLFLEQLLMALVGIADVFVIGFAVVITILCFSKKNPVRYLKSWIVKIDVNLQKKILGIAVPNGIEYCRRLSVYCKCR